MTVVKSDHPPEFPLYLVVAYNNLDALLNSYAESDDIRLLREALLISCRDLKRLVRDEGYWNAIHKTLGIAHEAEDYEVPDPSEFDIEKFLTKEYELLLGAGVRPEAIDRVISDLDQAYKRVKAKDARRFVRRLRARVDKLADVSCQRYHELLETDGWPRNVDVQASHKVIFVRCTMVVAGLVVAGADVFGAVHFPPAALLAKESVTLGFAIVEHGIDAPDTDFG